MKTTTFPSANIAYRRADIWVHASGLFLILLVGSALLAKAMHGMVLFAVIVYVFCALASNLASWCYHFSKWHERRGILRRLDHAAIYLSITGTFTPFFVLAGTTWTLTLLWICWGLTIIAVWNKFANRNVKSRWSTASYLGLGAIGLLALPDMSAIPSATPWWILAGVFSYVIGTIFYARKLMPYRYAIWHIFVTLGGLFMGIGIWIALEM